MARSCALDGSPDLYGLGVRVGVYCQITATIIANHGLPDALVSAIDTNVVFLLAILVAMVKASAEHALSTAEAFIMLQIILTFLLSVINIYGFRWLSLILSPIASENQYELAFAHMSLTKFGIHWRQFIYTSTVVYNLWFWFYGINTLNDARPCNFQIFFFGRVSGLGQIKVLYRIAAVVFVLFNIQKWRHLMGAVNTQTNKTSSVKSTHSEGRQESGVPYESRIKSLLYWGCTRTDRDKLKQAMDELR